MLHDATPGDDGLGSPTWWPPRMPDQPPISERLVRALGAQVAAVSATQEQYVQLGTLGDPVVQLLAGLAVSDERRHRQLLEHMAAQPRDRLDGTRSATALPDESLIAGDQVRDAVATTRSLIRDEREGARYLRHLARQERDLHDEVYALLLESMARDGEKHEHFLRFLLKRLEAAAA